MAAHTFQWFLWLFLAALIIHNIEESLLLPKWSQLTGRFHKPVGAFEFRFAVTVLTIIATIITVLFYVSERQSIPSYLFFSLNFGMLLNVFIPHLIATIILKKYCPGLLTGILLLLPITTMILWYGYQNEYFIFPMFWYISIPFVAIEVGMIPVLFKIGKKLKIVIVKTGIKDLH